MIYEKLEVWSKTAWAKHRIRTIKTSPIRLWVSGQLKQLPYIDVHLIEEEFIIYGLEGYIEEGDDTRPIFEAPIT